MHIFTDMSDLMGVFFTVGKKVHIFLTLAVIFVQQHLKDT